MKDVSLIEVPLRQSDHPILGERGKGKTVLPCASRPCHRFTWYREAELPPDAEADSAGSSQHVPLAASNAMLVH